MATIPTVGYWDMRGLGEPIRYLLKYASVKFNDKRYPFGEGTTLQEVENIRKYWTPDRFNLGLDFPNLPYYIDGDLKLTQSMVIMKHLGRKYGLVANDSQSLTRQDLVEQQLQDLIVTFVWPTMLWNNSDAEFEHKKKIFLDETLPQQLELLSKFLGNNQWLAGNLTYVDFVAYETLDWMRQFSPKCLDKWPNLVQYVERFEGLPAIAAYISSSEFKSWPILSPRSKWGHRR